MTRTEQLITPIAAAGNTPSACTAAFLAFYIELASDTDDQIKTAFRMFTMGWTEGFTSGLRYFRESGKRVENATRIYERGPVPTGGSVPVK